MNDDTEMKFWNAAREGGMAISGNGRVSSRDTATLLAVSPRTLENWRYQKTGPRHCDKPMGGCKVSYFLKELARWSDENSSAEAL